MTIESTPQIVEINGMHARMWKGYTENGVPVNVIIPLIGVDKEHDREEFEKELIALTNVSIEPPPLILINLFQ